MANWTPDGMVGQMFKIVAKHVPPPQGMESWVLWGDEATVFNRLSNGFTDIKFVRKYYPSWLYPFDVGGVVEYFRTVYGPVKRAFGSLDHAGQQPLREDLETVFSTHSGTKNGTTVNFRRSIGMSLCDSPMNQRKTDRNKGGNVMLPAKLRFELIERMSVKTMRYVSAVPRAKADGLVARIYDMIAEDFFINGSLTSHSKVPPLLAGVWTGRNGRAF